MQQPEKIAPVVSYNNRWITKVFKSLSDGTRQEILLLLEQGPRRVGEIVARFDLSQPTISRHLSVLKEADLVIDQRQGQHVLYRLNPEALARSMKEFYGLFQAGRRALA